jgi:hypothetical protein
MFNKKMFVWAASLSVVMIASGHAQTAAPAALEEAESMAEVMLGDHWSYEFRDNITGELKGTVTLTVTDVTANDISIRSSNIGRTLAYFTYDRDWNAQSSASWKYAPHDGTGVRLPLTVGKTWKIQSTDSGNRGGSAKRSGTSKVVAEEKLTTTAGNFNTAKIETSINVSYPNNPGRKTQMTMTTWYSPSVNHWVKRTVKMTMDGRVRENSTVELVDFGRR